MRLIHEIAHEIASDWRKPYFGAVPYLQAMHRLETLDDQYGLDDARSIVLYFLSNANTWRGPTARRVKSELKYMLARNQGAPLHVRDGRRV